MENAVDLAALSDRALAALRAAVWNYDPRIGSERINYRVEAGGVVLGCQAATHAEAQGYIDAFRLRVEQEMDSRAIL